MTNRVRALSAHMAEPQTLSAHGMPHQPLLVLEARPPDGQTFNRADYYRAALLQLGEPY